MPKPRRATRVISTRRVLKKKGRPRARRRRVSVKFRRFLRSLPFALAALARWATVPRVAMLRAHRGRPFVASARTVAGLRALAGRLGYRGAVVVGEAERFLLGHEGGGSTELTTRGYRPGDDALTAEERALQVALPLVRRLSKTRKKKKKGDA